MPVTIKPAQVKYKDPSTSQYVSIAAIADCSGIIDDTAGNGDTNKVWSADKSYDELSTKLSAPSTAGTSGQVLTCDGQGGQSWQTPSGGGGGISDVQINSTSIVSSGTANIPLAANGTPGVIQLDNVSSCGLAVSNGVLVTQAATDYQLLHSANNFQPIVPGVQHKSVYYGLSKLAGVDLANESVTVGTYPATSQAAICSMVGAIAAPASPSTGDFLCYNGTSWVATTLSVWQGGSY